MTKWFVLMLILHVPVFGQSWSGIIDSSRAADWSNVGISGGIPMRTAICATLAPSAGTTQINNAIANCPSGQVVLLSAGTYTITAGVKFNNKSNVTLRGAGPLQTILNFTGGDMCGGLGGNICMIDNIATYSQSSDVQPGGLRACNWTAGYAKGTTQITLTNCGSAPSLNQMIILDQGNDGSDTGGVYNCTSNCNIAGFSDTNGRIISGVMHSQNQVVKVISVSGSGSGPYSVTISPGLYANNWRSDRSPGAWWSGMIQNVGVEDMTLNYSNSTSSNAGVMFYDCYQCWMKNVRAIKSKRNHFWCFQSARIVVQDSYFYQTQSAAQESYGAEVVLSSDLLIQNNIWDRIASPFETDSTQGSVYAYNYSVHNWFMPAVIAVTQVSLASNIATVSGILSSGSTPSVGQAVYIDGTSAGGGIFNVNGAVVIGVTGLGGTGASGTIRFGLTAPNVNSTASTGVMTVNSSWMQTSDSEHGTGSQMNLYEGNNMNSLMADTYWGTSSVSTYFRNRLSGWQIGQTENTKAIFIGPYSRGYNLIGNVLGQSGFSNQYETSQGVGSTVNCDTSIYAFGWSNPGAGCKNSAVPYDGITRSTLMRWGNYDVVSGAVQWNSSEVPTTGVAYIGGSSVPTNHNLPPSFYLTSQPAFWNTPWGTPPWPAIGPEISGGNLSDVGGHANAIPAQLCYLNTAVDSAYSSHVLAFDARTCYGGTVLPASTVDPPTSLAAVVQ